MTPYQAFLARKRVAVPAAGFVAVESRLPVGLFDYQRAIVAWACQRGRAAIFAGTGLGKTAMQLAWADQVAAHTGRPVLIFAPLAVAHQTAAEGGKFSIPVQVCRTQADVRDGVNIANYEMLQHFTAGAFGGLVLDESSILKSYSGPTRQALTAFAAGIPYRLACTATPAPNDLIEITNHAEFLGISTGKEIIARFFTQDGNTTHAYRLMGHARAAFWRWLAQWAVALRSPADLGYDGSRFVLPPLHLEQITVEGAAPQGYLFPVEAQTLQERQQARRASLPTRVQRTADLVNATPGAWVVWCDLNNESEALRKAIPGSVEVKGSDTPDHKEWAMLAFARGEIRVLITKPSIAGFGMNWQHCHQIAFVGLSDSWEQYYQAIRRCWRFGQTQPVACYVVVADTEGAVVRNIERKEAQAETMMQELVNAMAGLSLGQAERDETPYDPQTPITLPAWLGPAATPVKVVAQHIADEYALYQADSLDAIRAIPADSIGLSIFSPPFPGMYAYSDSPHDVGNTDNIDQMIEHFSYLVPELLRIAMPGRMCCIHLMQLTAMKSRDGYIGVKDYRGRTIAAMEAGGWIYYGEVTIDKDPQVKAIRTKDRGLLFKTLANDSSHMHMALADYLIQFRKPGESPMPIRAGISQKYNNPNGWISEEEWIEWASPVWYRHVDPHGKTAAFMPGYPGLHQATPGISETDVLNVAQARDTNDERHLCPLQLGVIERAVKLWSNPGDVVFTPFLGVGSEVYEAVRWRRKGLGFELKGSYWQSAVRNVARAVAERDRPTLFDLAAAG